MKTLTIALTLLVAVLLTGSGLLVTHASNTTIGSQIQSQQSNKHQSDSKLLLNLQGGIANAGSQTWNLAGGNALVAQFGSEQLQPGSNLQYSLTATVNGLSTSGTFQLSLTGQTIDGQSISVTANGAVIGMVPLICFPNYDVASTGTCQATDTSTIPGFFEVGVVMSETLGSTTTTSQTVLLVETPIMNPWGTAVVMSSTDGTTANIIATYQTGSATWTNVQLVGYVSGTFNGQTASGSFFQVSTAVENFVAGTEYEYGTISLQSMSPSSLDATGTFAGTSTVPTDPSTMADCSAQLGIPAGTCTETALNSVGTFQMTGSSTQHGNSHASTTIKGSYGVIWPQPSITFAGTITATVSQTNHENR
jgi:hypothetical protein